MRRHVKPETARQSNLREASRPFGRVDMFLASGAGASALAAYVLTLCPTVGVGDAGELTLAAMKLGICHPPGYPLFTWLGRLAVQLPLSEPALATNLLTAVLAGAVVAFVFVSARSLGLGRVGSVTAALVFGFSATFWENATIHEVYALSMLFLALLLAVVPRARLRPARSLPFAGLLLGLAIAHQPGALFCVPALLVLLWRPDSRPGPAVALALVLLLVGLSSSLGTLVRSASGPEVNWGAPDNVRRFIDHAIALDYAGLAGRALSSRIARWPGIAVQELGVPAVLLVIAGIVFLARRHGRVLAALLLLLATALFGMSYDVGDFRVHMLPHFLALALLAGAGAHWVSARLRRLKAVGLVVLVAPLLTLAFNVRSGADGRTTLIRDLGHNIVNSLPRSAVFIHNHDTEGNAVKYVIAVRPVREDVLVISSGLLAERVYWAELDRKIGLPERDVVMRRARASAYSGGRALSWEAIKQYLLEPVIDSLLGSRPVYVSIGSMTPELQTGPALRGRIVAPSGMVNRILPESAVPGVGGVRAADEELWRSYALDAARRQYRTEHLAAVQTYYPSSRSNVGMYLLVHGDTTHAVRNLEAALEFPMPPDMRAAFTQNLASARGY